MKAIFCKDLNAHYNDAILNMAINLELNSADLHLTNGGGGRKSRLCASHYPLNSKFSLYALLFIFLTFLYFKFLVVASECIAQMWLSIIFFIDCHAKNRLCSFLFAMTANFVILSVATQRVARRKPQQKNPQRLKENLPFLDTSLTLSMTNSGFCLKIMNIFTQILKHKFKFFTQNLRHFVNSKHCINSTHFITLSQILSPTQGFFIFLPQVFAQFLLINSLQRSSYGRQDTKAPF